MARAVGIDLGTTNSVVAVLEGGEPTVIANAEGSRTTPSVVAFAKNGEVLVGEVAKRQAVTNPDRTIRSVKRHMGTDWSLDIDGKKYTAQEISARVLGKLKRDAETYLGEEITDAVVTTPAYFSDHQRQATKEAGQIARLTKTFNGQYGIDLAKDKMAMQRLREAAEKAKIELSASQSTNINLPYITAGADGPLHLDVPLSRAEFQRMTQDLLDRCKGPFQQVIKDASITVGQIDSVIMVGGSTRMPAVTELVKEMTGGKEPNKGVNPDEVVAVGASLQAGVLK